VGGPRKKLYSKTYISVPNHDFCFKIQCPSVSACVRAACVRRACGVRAACVRRACVRPHLGPSIAHMLEPGSLREYRLSGSLSYMVHPDFRISAVFIPKT